MLYAQTRKKSLVNTLFDLDLSVSYDRVYNITNTIGCAVSEMYNEQKVVCPRQLQWAWFTTAAVDNIDHNPSSSTSKGSFHGTAISLLQHATNEQLNSSLNIPALGQSSSVKTVPHLPTWYTNVPPDASLTKEQPPVCAYVNTDRKN